MLISEALEAGRHRFQVVRGSILRAATSSLPGPEGTTSEVRPHISLLCKSIAYLPADLRGSHRQTPIAILTSRTSQNDAFGRLKACSQIGDIQHAV
jgi:hypothetical protein